MIKLDHVTKIFPVKKANPLTAVNDVCLEIGQGEFILIVGRSGSGKTTLLNLAAGLTRPTSGMVLMEGTDLWSLNDKQQSFLRSQKIGFVFQFPSLLPSLTVCENVLLPAVFSPQQYSIQTHERSVELLGKMGLEEKLNAYPRQLSAGQQQRVVIARSLMNQPHIILADEPTSNLDEKTEIEIMEIFHDLHRNMGITIVMVTHTNQLVSYGTRIIEMATGEILTGLAK